MTTMRYVLLLALLTLGIVSTCPAAKLIGGLPPDEALRAGERMYREGILPSGEPMQALVQGDIPVDGSMFTCQNCHLRSGLGTAEGTIISLPTNGGKLFRTLHRGAEIETNPPRHMLAKPFQSEDIRPAYNDESLAEAIWTGTTPSGREMSQAMPRYRLDPPEMEILIYYLKQLSTDFSPGVDAKTLSFATIITDDVPEPQAQSMLGVLQAYVRDHNRQSRHDARRARRGPFYRQDRFASFRLFDLSVWRLHGQPDSWPAQLETYLAGKPVFALLGGISTRDWTPIERFCNDHRLPCIFPVTQFPGNSPDNWYTLYFSRGLVEEGETAVRYLLGTGKNRKSVTPMLVYSDREDSQTLLAASLRQWQALSRDRVHSRQLPAGQHQRKEFWQTLLKKEKPEALIIWLPKEDLQELFEVATGVSLPERVILSWRLLGKDPTIIPAAWRENVELTYPYRLPEQLNNRLSFVRSWLKLKNLPVRDLEIQAQMYFLGWLLTGSTRMMGDDFYRDYFLDVIDMMNDEVYAIATVPRVSFGPGQRHAVKGCYVVKIDPANPHRLLPQTPWVVY